MNLKPTIWVLFTTVLMSVGLTLSATQGRCSPVNDYPLSRGESVSINSPIVTDVDQAPNAVTVAFNVTNASCYGKHNGSITALPSGGIAPYTYAWSNGKTTQTINNLAAGTYSVTVTGAQGSGTATGTATVTQPTQIVAYISCTKTCPNQCNGTASVIVATGGTGPFTYQWSTTATTSTISGLCPGTYWVTITDANGCKKIVGAMVLSYPAVSLSGITTSVSCNANCTGTITQTVSGGGGAPFTYIWNDGATTKNRTALCAGQYCVTVTSSKGCTATACYTITQTTPPSVTLTPNNPPCYGGTGSITSNVSGGTAPYSYLWSNGQTTADLSGLATGSYSVTVTDANQCTNSASTNIAVPATPIAVVASATACSPFVACLGTATAVGSNGTAPYTYVWSNGQTGANASGLCIGVYTVTATDANGCSTTDTAAIKSCSPPPCTYPISINSNIPCGATSTTLSVNLSSVPAGSTPTAYAWYIGSVGTTVVGTSATYVAAVPGTYCVRVTFASATQECTAETCTTLTAPVGPTVDVTGNNPTCYGKSTGNATATVSGGVGPFTYVWSNGKTTQTINNLPAGTYNVTVTASNGCTATDGITLTNPPQIIAYVNCTKTCPNECSATINLTVIGGTPPYTYHWSNGATSEDISNACAGIYWVTITDANGCNKVVGAQILTYPAFNISSSVTQPTCAGICNGAIDISVSGGGGPGYTYIWSNGKTTQDINNLCGGAYSVTVTSVKGCTATASFNLVQPEPTSCTVTNDTICLGGTGELCASTATTYLWSTGSTNQCIAVTDAGVYTVTTTNGTGCSSVCTGVLVTNQAPPCTITGDDFCYGDSTALCAATASAYLWSNGATTQCITVFTGGTYEVTVTYANGCTTTCEKSVQAFLPPVITTVPSDVTCAGLCNGSITAFVTGDISALTYNWSVATTSNTATLSELCPGEYCVTVTDVNGCSAAACDSVETPEPLNPTIVATDVTCYGYCDGTATAGAYGGTEPYEILWSNGATTWTVDSLCADDYSFTVTDILGCTTVGDLTIGQPTLLIVGTEATDVNCFNDMTGSVTAFPSGGTPPYSIVWNTGDTTWTIIDLVAGEYCFTVTDMNGCTATGCDSVNEPEQLLALIVCPCPLALCPGDCSFAADLEVFGGTPPYTYEWSNGATTQDVTNLCEGMYSVTVTDANGCTFDAQTAPFEWADSIEIQLVSTNVSCYGECDGSAGVGATGGFGTLSIEWANGDTTWAVGDLCEGTYCFTVTDELGCTAEGCVSIAQPDSLVAVATSADATCYQECDGSAYVVATGGTAPYTYAWSNEVLNDSISELCAGEYCVTVTDFNGCTAVACVNIEDAPELTAIATATNPLCYGGLGSVSASANGGTGDYTYMWSNDATTQTIEGLEAGIYCVTVTDENGCTATACDTIEIPTEILFATTFQMPTCYGVCDGGIALLVTGGTEPYSFEWSNGATTQGADSLCEGTYCVTVTDANGCVDSICIAVPGPELLTVVAAGTNVTCYGDCNGTASALAAGGTAPYTYAWSDNSTAEAIIGLCAGTYYVTAIDANGCTAVDTVNITQPDSIIITLIGDSVSCYGSCDGSATISVTGGTGDYTYVWNTLVNLDSLCAGEYCVTVYDANQCSATACVTIGQPTLLTASSESTDVNCFNDNTGSITVTVDGGTPNYSITWDNGETTFTINDLVAGIYCYTVTDANGCTATGCDTVNEPEQLLALVICPCPLALCPGDCSFAADLEVYGGTPPYAYEWSNGATTQDVDSLCAGMYSVTVTDANGCTFDVQTAPFEWADSITAIVTSEDVTCNGACNGTATVSADGGFGELSIVWNTEATTWTVDSLCAGEYCFTITDELGCTYSDCVTIEEPAQLTVTISTDCVPIFCGGVATAAASGGTGPYSYAWSNGDNGATADSLCNEVAYYVTVTDANGCELVDTATVVCFLPPCEFPITINVNTACGDTTATLTVAGVPEGYSAITYAWYASADPATILDTNAVFTTGAGEYCVHVEIINVNGSICVADTCATVELLENPTVTATATPDSCSEAGSGTASALAAGGTDPYSYLWSNGATDANITGLEAGSYSVTVTDANGCTATDDVEVLFIECPCDTLRTQTMGGWGAEPNGNNPATYLHANFDAAFPTDLVVGCVGGETLTLTSAQAVTDFLVSTGPKVALDQSYVDPGASYGNNLASQLVAATLSVGFDYNDPSFGQGSQNLGDMIILDGPFQGWTVNQLLAEANNALGGCGSAYTFTQLNDALDAINNNYDNGTSDDGFLGCDSVPVCDLEASVESTDITCYGVEDGTITVTATNGTEPYVYAWANGATTNSRTDLGFGTYEITVTDANGCEVVVEATIEEPAPLTVDTTVVQPTFCFENCNGSISLEVSGGTSPYAISWSNGESNVTSIDSLCAGSYSVTVTDANGCTAPAFGNIIELFCPPCDLVADATSTDVTCYGACDGTASVTYTGNNVIAPITYAWSNGGNTSTIEDLCAGTYYVTVSDVNGCQNTDSVTISEPGAIFVDLAVDLNAGICGDDSCNGYLSVGILAGGTAPFAFEWNNGATDASIGGLCAGEYTVTIMDANGCSLEVGPLTITCEPPPCEPLRTQTQGGWGAVPQGNNPGVYLHANFDDVFGAQLVIGCDNTLTFTSAQAITNWLPSGTTPEALPAGNITDPTTYNNVFAAQLLAATLNVGFDYDDADFGGGDQNLGDMYIADGAFAGWTVNQLIEEANSAIGGCGSPYSYAELSAALDSINNNYDDGDGTDNGYLTCESPLEPTFRQGAGDETIVANVANVSAYPNPFSANANIEFTLATDDNVTLEVYNVTGQKVAELFNGLVNANQKYNVNFDGAQLADGVYIYRLVTSNDTFTGQLTRVKP